MLKGIDEKGNLQNVHVSEDGAVKVFLKDDENEDIKEHTILSEILTIDSTTATTKSINNAVTSIMVANYSENANVTMEVGNSNFQIGPNLAVELPINEEVTNISLSSTEDDNKIQLVVKGVR